MRGRYLFFMVLVCLTLSLYIPVQAQSSTSETCSAFVETAFQKVGTNCANMEAGSLCYGHPTVTVIGNASPNGEFSEADRISLLNVTSIHTEPYAPAENNLGIAILNVQANLPRGFPGKGAVLMSVGNTSITNAVPAEDALILPEKSLNAAVGEAGADLYNVPPGFSIPSQLFSNIPSGTILRADGISADGQWLRVFVKHDQKYSQSATAWVKRSALAPNVDVSNLPTIDANTRTSMQSFYLNNLLDQPACKDIPPSMLYIQGPEELQVDLTVNGTDIHFSSTILLRILPSGNRMQMIVLAGLGLLYPDTPNEIVITPGFASEICLADVRPGDDPNKRTIGQNCTWSAPQVLSFDELESLYNQLDNKIPENLQYYPTYVPRLVCPSGVGQVQCSIRLTYVALIIRLNDLCQTGILPTVTCDQYILR